MAKRFTDTELWDKVWFMELDCKLKCLVKMVRDKADLCGVWSPNWVIASMYVGEKVTEQDLLKIDRGNQFKKLENGKIYCIGFVEFQCGELSEKSPVHRKIITLLTQNDILETYRQIPYQYPINRVQEEEEDKEEEKEEDKVKEEYRPKKTFIEKDLSDIEAGKTVEFCKITLHRDYTILRVHELWKAFLINNEKEFYNKESDRVRHFRNWIKNQPHGSNAKTPGGNSKSNGAIKMAGNLKERIITIQTGT